MTRGRQADNIGAMARFGMGASLVLHNRHCRPGAKPARAGRLGKNPRRHVITAEQFRDARVFSGLTRIEVADLLGVSLRTIGHWERGAARPSYAAFKLLRVLRHGELVDPRWSGYRIVRGKLVTPENHELAPSDMAWLSLLVRRSAALSQLLIVRDVRGPARRAALRKLVPVSPDWTLQPLSIDTDCTPNPPVPGLVRGREHVPAASSAVVLSMERPTHRTRNASPESGAGLTENQTLRPMTKVTPPTPQGSYQTDGNRMAAADCAHRRNTLHPCSNTGKILLNADFRANRRAGGVS